MKFEKQKTIGPENSWWWISLTDEWQILVKFTEQFKGMPFARMEIRYYQKAGGKKRRWLHSLSPRVEFKDHMMAMATTARLLKSLEYLDECSTFPEMNRAYKQFVDVVKEIPDIKLDWQYRIGDL